MGLVDSNAVRPGTAAADQEAAECTCHIKDRDSEAIFFRKNGPVCDICESAIKLFGLPADGCRGSVSRMGLPTPCGRPVVTIKDSCQSTSRYVSHKVSPWNDLVLVAGNIKPLLCELPTSQKEAPMLPQLFVDDSSGVVDNRAGSAAIFRQR